MHWGSSEPSTWHCGRRPSRACRRPCSARLIRSSERPSTRLEHYLGVERDQAQRVRTLLSHRARDIGFSRDLDYGIFDVRTVAFIALQVAYHHLGFTEIYLAGVDLNAQAPRFYERRSGPRSPCGLDEHLHNRILPGLRVMQEVMAAEGRQVFNLSRTSRIPAELIPLADLAAVEAAWLGRRTRQASSSRGSAGAGQKVRTRDRKAWVAHCQPSVSQATRT